MTTLDEAIKFKIEEMHKVYQEYRELLSMTDKEFILSKSFLIDIDENELEYAIRNALNTRGFKTVFSVTQITKKELLFTCRNLGVKRIEKLESFLKAHDLGFKKD